MNKSRKKFSLADEGRIIEFVKKHEILYNVRHEKFRDSEAKNRLWQKLADEIYAEVTDVRKKWANMRDYFIRNQTKKSSGEPVGATKRDKLMMFLLDSSIPRRRTMSTVPSNQEDVDFFSLTQLDVPKMEPTSENDELDPNEYSNGHSDSADMETPQYIRTKRRAPSTDPDELLYGMISTHKQNPMAYLAPTTSPKDHLDYFFESLASTMRTFPALSVATLKLKMSQLVGEEEVRLAQLEQVSQTVHTQYNQPAMQDDATRSTAQSGSNATEQHNLPSRVSSSNVLASDETIENNEC